MKESTLRTLVPVAVALLVRVGLKDWLGLDDATVLGLATVLVTGIYYVAVRVTERYFPAAGILLGYPSAPTYDIAASNESLED